MKMIDQATRDRVNEFCEGLTFIDKVYTREHFAMLEPYTYGCDFKGRKYLRITRNRGGRPESVECFVDAGNGNIYYPAGYKAPSLDHVRGNIGTDEGMRTLYARKWLNHHGYLYLDSIKASDEHIKQVDLRVIKGLLSPIGF